MKAAAAIPILVAAHASAAAAAAPLTAEQAIRTQREGLVAGARLDCKADPAPDEIVVCGRDGADPNRLPLDEPVPGERVRLLPGEPPSARAALSGGGGCSTVGPNHSCGGGLNVFAVIGVLLKLKQRLDENRDR